MLAAAALADLERRLALALEAMGIADQAPAAPIDQAAPVEQVKLVNQPAPAEAVDQAASAESVDQAAPAEVVLAQGDAPAGGRNVTDFFSILAARHDADQGRLAFWSRYLEQVTWTRLVLGADTLALQHGDAGVRDLIARQHGRHASMTKDQGQDALMMVINGHLIVEFAKLPDAAYIYRMAGIKFDRDAGAYGADLDDLKYGYREFGHRDGKVRRITHIPGWQQDAGAQLKRINIVPDIPAAQRTSTATRQPTAPTFTMQARVPVRAWVQDVPAPPPVIVPVVLQPHELAPAGAKFTMARLAVLVQQFDKASIDDQRASGDGCLWVLDPVRRRLLASALMELGFSWSGARMAWYFPQR